MLKLASAKMPGVHPVWGDFSKGPAEPLRRQRYDFVTATYSLHRLTDPQKISLLIDLRGVLKQGGRILIGDVAFENRNALNECRQKSGDEWDDDEIYFVADGLRRVFPSLEFRRLSYCAGVLTRPRQFLRRTFTAQERRKRSHFRARGRCRPVAEL